MFITVILPPANPSCEHICGEKGVFVDVAVMVMSSILASIGSNLETGDAHSMMTASIGGGGGCGGGGGGGGGGGWDLCVSWSWWCWWRQ